MAILEAQKQDPLLIDDFPLGNASIVVLPSINDTPVQLSLPNDATGAIIQPKASIRWGLNDSSGPGHPNFFDLDAEQFAVLESKNAVENFRGCSAETTSAELLVHFTHS